jgi:hypothetical protein
MSRSGSLAGSAALVLVLGLAACGDDDEPAVSEPTGATVTVTETVTPSPTASQTSTDDDDDTSTAEPTGTATGTATATGTGTATGTAGPTEPGVDEEDLPPMSQDVAVQAYAGGADGPLPTTVRFGEHPGYDRVVFDFIGDVVPGYRVEYVPQAVQDGSGAVVEVDGEAILQVRMEGVRIPDPNETPPGGPGTFEPDEDEVVEEVRLEGTFEGIALAWVGVDDRQRDFRVFTLTDPVRLVVDVSSQD